MIKVPYTIFPIKADGNCQYRAIACFLNIYEMERRRQKQDSARAIIYRNLLATMTNTAPFYGAIDHEEVRLSAVTELGLFPDIYKDYIDGGNIQQLIKDQSNDAEWGDYVTLRAISEAYQINIIVHHSDNDKYEPTPRLNDVKIKFIKSYKKPTVHLLFARKLFHYDLIIVSSLLYDIDETINDHVKKLDINAYMLELYHKDIVEEDTFLNYPYSDLFRTKIRAFLTWLQEAEEESSC